MPPSITASAPIETFASRTIATAPPARSTLNQPSELPWWNQPRPAPFIASPPATRAPSPLKTPTGEARVPALMSSTSRRWPAAEPSLPTVALARAFSSRPPPPAFVPTSWRSPRPTAWARMATTITRGLVIRSPTRTTRPTSEEPRPRLPRWRGSWPWACRPLRISKSGSPNTCWPVPATAWTRPMPPPPAMGAGKPTGPGSASTRTTGLAKSTPTASRRWPANTPASPPRWCKEMRPRFRSRRWCRPGPMSAEPSRLPISRPWRPWKCVWTLPRPCSGTWRPT